jgi:hypothetical protein
MLLLRKERQLASFYSRADAIEFAKGVAVCDRLLRHISVLCCGGGTEEKSFTFNTRRFTAGWLLQ